MQPRRDLCPRVETVFHVTKRGCSCSGLIGGVEEVGGNEEKEELEEDFDVSVRAVREEVAEREDGVDELDPDDEDGF